MPTSAGCDVGDVRRVVDAKTGLSWASPDGWTQKNSVADAFGLMTSPPVAGGDDSDPLAAFYLEVDRASDKEVARIGAFTARSVRPT